MNEHLQNIFIEEFLRQFEEKEQKKILINREQQLIAERKSKRLNAIRQFLDQFVEQGVMVYHKDRFNKDIPDKEQIVKEEQSFKHYDADSSAVWSPGISIWFDHPAEVEIAVPNEQKDGFIIIKVATPNKHSHILENKYENVEDACKALAKFLCLHTLSVNPNYKKVLKDYEQKNNLAQVLGKNEDAQSEKSFLLKSPLHPPAAANSIHKDRVKVGVPTQTTTPVHTNISINPKNTQSVQSAINKAITYGKDQHNQNSREEKSELEQELQAKE